MIDENGGALFSPFSERDCEEAIEKVLESNIEKNGKYNIEKVKLFEIGEIKEQLGKIYFNKD